MVEPWNSRSYPLLFTPGTVDGSYGITAGGTQEPIDPVRSITNRSSGKQGFALAQAALDFGAQVTLIAGPVSLPTPVGAGCIDVHTAQEMLDAVQAHIPGSSALIMAAAVADFRPSSPAGQKIKRVLRSSGNPSGFPSRLVSKAKMRRCAGGGLQAKHLDLIVANNISARTPVW
jgi:phosphopantothenoylcysteine decarboxylase/phosphopantothenate--cysteine ligase